MRYGTEQARLTSLVAREGVEAAVDFAKRTIAIYHSHIRHQQKELMHCGVIGEHVFFRSCMEFKRFINDNR